MEDNKDLRQGIRKRITLWTLSVVVMWGLFPLWAPASSPPDVEIAPVYGVTIPDGYRDWKMIAVAQLKTNKVDQLRAQFGNEIAIKAFQQRTRPFPDGSIIVALHWTRVLSEDNDKVLDGPFAGAQSFVVGSPVNMQVMVKDSKKYAGTGGWGFGDFKDGKPGSEDLHKTCFPCHEPARDRDFVFTRYAP